MTKPTWIALTLGLGLLAAACAHGSTTTPRPSADSHQVITFAPHARHQDGPPAKTVDAPSSAKETH